MRVSDLYAFALLSVIFVLFWFGIIGPKWLRGVMQRINRWLDYEAQLFFPLDPYKPLSKSLPEGWSKFMPHKARLWQARTLLLILSAIIILGILFTVVLIGVGHSGN